METDLVVTILSAAGVIIIGISSTLFGVIMARFTRLESRLDDLDRRDRHDSRDIRGQITTLMAQRHVELGERIEEFINGFRHLVGIILDRSIHLHDQKIHTERE
jgi:hypothetical protein